MRVVAFLAVVLSLASAAPALAQGRAVVPTPEEVAALTSDCARGDQVRCIHLGILHRRGMGVEANPRRAIELFVSACEGGYSLACAFAGDMAYAGSGVAESAEHGEALMRGACRKRNEWACETLRRRGLIRNRTDAVS